MLLYQGGYVPRGVGAEGSAVVRDRQMQSDPAHAKAAMQLTPMFRGVSYHPANHPPVLTLEDSMAAQILEAMSPKSSISKWNTSREYAPTATDAGYNCSSPSSPRTSGFSERLQDSYYYDQQLTQSGPTNSPKKRAYESSDEEDDHAYEPASDHDVDMDGGMVLSEELQREILTRPPKPDGDAEWRVEWCAEQSCWSWIHHKTHGQIFTDPLAMDNDARDRAAASAPVAAFEASQLNRKRGPTQRTASQGWTSDEEQQLKDLVAEHGPGDWGTKSSMFKTDRSASALRHRWYSVHAGYP